MILQLKTKQPQSINILDPSIKDIIYMIVGAVNYNKENFEAVIWYETRTYHQMYEDVPIVTQSHNLINPKPLIFTRSEVIALEQALSVSGADFPSKFDDLITKAALYKIDQDKVLGLTANDFEIV